MLSDRPYVSCMFGRELRRLASYYFRNNQFTEEQFDQFMAKCRSLEVVSEICEEAEYDEDFSIKEIPQWLSKNWTALRELVDAFDDVNLEAPELYYNMAPASRGRKAQRAAGPRYQTDTEFQADKDLFETELNEKESS